MKEIPDIEDFLYDLMGSDTTVSHLCERGLGTLVLLEEACLPNDLRSTSCAIRLSVACVIALARFADRSEYSRSYLWNRLAEIKEQFLALSGEEALSIEIQRSQSIIKRMDNEIAAKKSVISKIDEAATVALDNLVADQSLRIKDSISSDACPFRAERALRRGGAYRSRGGKSQTTNLSYENMAMNQETITIATAEGMEANFDDGLMLGLTEVIADPVGSTLAPEVPAIAGDVMECELPCRIKRKAQSSPENVVEDIDDVSVVQTSRARKTRILGDESDAALEGDDKDFSDIKECAVLNSVFNESMTFRSGRICVEDNNASFLVSKDNNKTTLDTIVIENSSEDEFVAPKKPKRKYTKKSKPKQEQKPIRKAFSSSNLADRENKIVFDDHMMNSRFSREDLLGMGASNLGYRGLDYVSEVDSMRASSTNLALVEKVETTGDVSHLRLRNQELTDELKESKKRESRMQKEIDDLQSAITDLRREVRTLKDGGSFSIQERKDHVFSADKVHRSKLESVTNELHSGGTPGCSGDSVYMTRDVDWCTDSGVSWAEPMGSEGDIAASKTGEVSHPYPYPDPPHRSSGPSRGIKVLSNVEISPSDRRFNHKKRKASSAAINSTAIRDNNPRNSANRGAGNVREPVPSSSSASRGVVYRTPRANSRATKKNSEGVVTPAKRWVSKPAVVTITRTNEELSYAKILSTARAKVSLIDIGIAKTKIRKAANGGLIIEVPGPDGVALAEKLQVKLKSVLGDAARAGKCSASDIKVSNISPMRDGMGVIWMRCPSAIAHAIARLGRINLEPPPGVLDTGKWFGSINGSAAVMWVPEVSRGLACNLVKKDELDRLTMYISDKYIICGDFNLKSTLWGCPLSDRRGNKLSNWAASRDLRLINSGEVPTFMGARGSSIIDLTWASSSLVNSVQNWSVLQEVEPLSDHAYIFMHVADSSSSRDIKRTKPKGWSFKRIGSELFKEVLNWYGSLGPTDDDLASAADLAAWITRGVSDACDASAPRLATPRGRTAAYWWNDAVETCTIDGDLWGLPYKVVMNKLRIAGPGLSEKLSGHVLQRLLDSLFPPEASAASAAEVAWHTPQWDDAWQVSILEVDDVFKKAATRNVAPGPDCIKSQVWRKVPRSIVSIDSEGRSFADFPIKARPICLLDELGKAFERVIATRLQDWMDENPKSGLSDFQFGFRRHCSTVDALLKVRNFIEAAVSVGGIAIAVSLDIANAFNSIPWRVINDALDKGGFPEYLRRVIRDYLSNRTIEYKVRDGISKCGSMRAGVSQGSVLGSLLWDVAFDPVLCLEQEEVGGRLSITGYVESKAANVSRSLFRLMPNLRGPYEEKRRVLQRSTAIRVVSGYRTISFDVATLLARMPPWTLEVAMRRRVYERVTDLRRRNEWSKEAVADLKKQERNIMNRRWSVSLNRPGAPGVFTRGIIMPHFTKWLGRKFENTSFRMTQMLTGHGCFGYYLSRMRKRDLPACLHCTAVDDTVEHIIYECPAWVDQRMALWSSLSQEAETMDLGCIIETIVDSQTKWFAFSLFANSVME
ncbi:reverse transcriptase, partial [Lasius niger]